MHSTQECNYNSDSLPSNSAAFVYTISTGLHTVFFANSKNTNTMLAPHTPSINHQQETTGQGQEQTMKDSREPLATASAHSSFSMSGLSRPGLQAVGLADPHDWSVHSDMYIGVKRMT